MAHWGGVAPKKIIISTAPFMSVYKNRTCLQKSRLIVCVTSDFRFWSGRLNEWLFCRVGRDAMKSATNIWKFCGNLPHILNMAAVCSYGPSVNTRWFKYDRDWFFLKNHNYQTLTCTSQCGLFTKKSVPVIFEPPCTNDLIFYLTFHKSTNKNKVEYRTCQE
jgi:hypothetical protein